MRLVCAPESFAFPDEDVALQLVLYGQPSVLERGSASSAAKHEILHRRLNVAPRAWDFLSLALSVATADLAGHRDQSPDRWTREFELEVAVADPAFWTTQVTTIQQTLCIFSPRTAGSCALLKGDAAEIAARAGLSSGRLRRAFVGRSRQPCRCDRSGLFREKAVRN
jgi:hypothetical protein